MRSSRMLSGWYFVRPMVSYSSVTPRAAISAWSSASGLRSMWARAMRSVDRPADSRRSTTSCPAVPISVWTRTAAPVAAAAPAIASRRRCSLRVIRWYEAPPLIAPARAGSSGSPGSFQSDGCMPAVRSVTIRVRERLDGRAVDPVAVRVVGVAVVARRGDDRQAGGIGDRAHARRAAGRGRSASSRRSCRCPSPCPRAPPRSRGRGIGERLAGHGRRVHEQVVVRVDDAEHADRPGAGDADDVGLRHANLLRRPSGPNGAPSAAASGPERPPWYPAGRVATLPDRVDRRRRLTQRTHWFRRAPCVWSPQAGYDARPTRGRASCPSFAISHRWPDAREGGSGGSRCAGRGPSSASCSRMRRSARAPRRRRRRGRGTSTSPGRSCTRTRMPRRAPRPPR